MRTLAGRVGIGLRYALSRGGPLNVDAGCSSFHPHTL